MPRERQVPLVSALSRSDLERRAEALLTRHHPRLLTEPGPFPVLDFLEFTLGEDYGVDFGVSSLLPAELEGLSRPSRRTGRPEILIPPSVYEALVDDDGRARFTGMHEAFHGLVHVNQLQRAIVHNVYTGLHRESTIPAYRNPEWQSNWFSGAVLMPRSAAAVALQQHGPDVHRLAERFGVSYSAMSYRLSKLVAQENR